MEKRSTTYHVHALTRGLAILRLLAREQEPLTLGDIHTAMEIPKSSLVRLLSVLQDGGFVVRTDDAYVLGHAVLDLVIAYEATANVADLAVAYLTAIAEATGQTTNLAILEGRSVRHVAVVEPDRPIRFRSTTGSLDDAYCTGVGKVLLAALPIDDLDQHLPSSPYSRRTENTIVDRAALLDELVQIRLQRFAEDNEEGDIGVKCLAVPIDLDSGIFVALSISGPRGEFSADNRQAYLQRLSEGSSAIIADGALVGALRVASKKAGESS